MSYIYIKCAELDGIGDCAGLLGLLKTSVGSNGGEYVLRPNIEGAICIVPSKLRHLLATSTAVVALAATVMPMAQAAEGPGVIEEIVVTARNIERHARHIPH